MNPTATRRVQSPIKGAPNGTGLGQSGKPGAGRTRSKTDWQKYLERPETTRLVLRDLCRNLGLDDARNGSPLRSTR
jgi:hypothetical protein